MFTILYTVPNQPVLRGIVPFTKAVVVIWSAPVPRPGPILQYNVDYRVGESSFSDVAFESNTFLSTVITGIENTVGESHTVRIRALTAKGWGDYSDLYSFEFTPIGKTISIYTMYIMIIYISLPSCYYRI